MRVLRNRIFEMEYQKYLDSVASKRKLVSTGDRSAKLEHNYPQIVLPPPNKPDNITIGLWTAISKIYYSMQVAMLKRLKAVT